MHLTQKPCDSASPRHTPPPPAHRQNLTTTAAIPSTRSSLSRGFSSPLAIHCRARAHAATRAAQDRTASDPLAHRGAQVARQPDAAAEPLAPAPGIPSACLPYPSSPPQAPEANDHASHLHPQTRKASHSLDFNFDVQETGGSSGRGRGLTLSETNGEISARRCPRCSPRPSRSNRRPCGASGRSSRSGETPPRRAAP